MKIAIYGLGYVGLTAAACLTREGHTVIGVDVNEAKIAQINQGKSPISEHGLEELLSKAVTGGLIRAMQHPGDELDTCDMAIVCVGTPSASDGSHNMSFIAEVSRQIATSVRRDRAKPLTVVFRSTFRPGTMRNLVQPVFEAILGADIGVVELVYNPEFLRESQSIADYFSPPKIVIGTKDGGVSENMQALNANIQAPTFLTRYEEAEFTKLMDNTFHAVKVSFANEIGRVCTQLGISATQVYEIFVADTKLNISPYYLRPGGAFGGSCLPKDVRALQFLSQDVAANTHLIDALIRSNEAHKHFLFEHATKRLEPGARVLMLGLAFKKGTDDLRESPNLDLARKILAAGLKLDIVDPALNPAALIGQNLGYAYSHLPSLSTLLVDAASVDLNAYDLIVDTVGLAKDLGITSEKLVALNTLR